LYIVTGGAGFIGSAFVWKLNQMGINDILIVDDMDSSEKWKNLVNRKFSDYMDKNDFLDIMRSETVPFPIDGIIHMGACSSTTETDADFMIKNNYLYSKTIAEWCLVNGFRLIYASSAATYGDGSFGFSDSDQNSLCLQPLNIYGYSKQLFDLWLLRKGASDRMVGIKFFNVFGPNEYHKGDMTSVIFKAYHQIKKTGKVRLFKSYRPEYEDGEQLRDFVYIKDCVEVMWWLFENREVNGIFNLGTGRARTWNDLANAVFSSMGKKPHIEYIEMPENIKGKYQYYTEANMEKLKQAGCPVEFCSLEEAVNDYVKNYLMNKERYL
jgi:ADP-L-glycero-D-manno-heptose 6-epimerase